MHLDLNIVSEVIGGNRRFIDPFNGLQDSYFIFSSQYFEDVFDAKSIGLYYDKLRYAVSNADRLIEGAFDNRFYEFYGVNKNQVDSPAQMCSGLIFDSFALDTENNCVGAYLTNDRFMFGHFIEVWWDSNWNVRSIWIN